MLVVLLLSIAAGLTASWGAYGYLKNKARQIELQYQQPQVERIVAAYDLPAGTRLETDLLAVRQFPADLVPSGSLAPAQVAQLLGKQLLAELRAGDMVVQAQAAAVATATFSQQLSKGRRALTLPVDSINSVSGLLVPGDMIDLYVSFDHQRKRITAPLLQGVRVLAAGMETDVRNQSGSDMAGQAFGTITLDTSPEDAVKLVAARQSGTITAMLRAPQDDGASQKAMRGDLASLLGMEQSAAGQHNGGRSVVIYGNHEARDVPALQAVPVAEAPAQGVFDLPLPVGLASQGLRQGRGGAMSFPAGPDVLLEGVAGNE